MFAASRQLVSRTFRTFSTSAASLDGNTLPPMSKEQHHQGLASAQDTPGKQRGVSGKQQQSLQAVWSSGKGIMIIFAFSEYDILGNKHALNKAGSTQFNPAHKGRGGGP
jgi:hypothetical protein